jgi:enamine deaminase RidA (YjgF/YER057c/UK114 family)
MHVRLRTLALTLVPLAAALALGAFTDPGQVEGVRHLNPEGRSDDLPYSYAVQAGGSVWVAGTLGLDPRTGAVPADPADEVRLALDGIVAKLALARMSMDDLVSVQVFCTDLSLYDAFNGVYRTYFRRGFPARAFIGSGPLLRGARFEINGVAAR